MTPAEHDVRRPPVPLWSRRDVLRHGIASVALLCSVGPSGSRTTATSAARQAQARSPFAPFRADLPLMPELSPVARTAGADIFEMDIREGLAELLPGFQTPIFGYEGLFPGPTIHARRGRTCVVRQRNTLGFDTNVHLHGGAVPARHDGHPMDVIAPGASFEYRYPNDQGGALLWYHDHAHGHTARTLYFGLAGAYVLHDPRDEELELPAGAYDVPLVIADRSFHRDGSLRYAENVDLGVRGDTILVNGAVVPRMRVERRIYRLRLLNASNARSYDLRLGDGRPFVQIAGDGGLLERPVTRRSLPLHPAERVELLVDFRGRRPGSEIVLHNTVGERTTRAVMRFDVVRGGAEEARMPDGRMREPERPPAPGAFRRWELGLATVPRVEWQIGGMGFDAARVDVRTGLGTSELWQWHNATNRVHPMHLHGMFFRVVARSSGAVHPAERAWKDTIGVLPGERVTVQPWFRPYRGRYVFHCHALEHAERAMMLQLEVGA